MLILYLGTYELLVFSGGTVSPIPYMVFSPNNGH